jgi:Uma2 family endonuclease
MVATKLVTAEELLEMPEEPRTELIEGVVVEMSPAKGGHGVVVQRLTASLVIYLRQQPIAELWSDGQTGFFVGRNPDSVLVPDLALTSLDGGRHSMDEDHFVETVPFLVVEVKSPSERESSIARKTALYRAAGVREQWWVRPQQRQVWVHRDDRAPLILEGDAVLASDDLLPGFRFPLGDLFS